MDKILTSPLEALADLAVEAIQEKQRENAF